jgi:uncharacterized membrane protein
LALNSKIVRDNFTIVEKTKPEYILIPAVVLIVFGVIIMIMNSKSGNKIKHLTEEVPIYQGEGKKRRIVGYRVQ